MHKLRIGTIVLLTLAVLIAGAYFPKIVSLAQDWHNSGKASSNPIMSVQLEIKKDIPSLGRLAMMCNMEGSISLTESKAKMTKEEVMTAVRTELQPYIDTQLIVYFENEVTLSPCLIQVPDMPELQGIVWFVSIAGDPAYFSALHLVVDDETGHILQINYAHESGINAMPSDEALSLLADIFFSSLEIDHNDQPENADTEYAYDYLNPAKRYSFNDPQFGDVFVDFYIYPDGFYTECSNF